MFFIVQSLLSYYFKIFNHCHLYFQLCFEIPFLIVFFSSYVDAFEDSKTPFHTSSRIGTAQTIKSTGTIVTRKNPFKRNIMSVDNMKVENVDKFYNEIDKSKLAPPVIVRGPMPKIVSFIENVVFNI